MLAKMPARAMGARLRTTVSLDPLSFVLYGLVAAGWEGGLRWMGGGLVGVAGRATCS